MFKDYISEKKEFSPLEDNPLVYVLIIAKLMSNKKGSDADVTEDENLQKLISLVDKNIIKKFNTIILKNVMSPSSVFDYMRLRKNSKTKLKEAVMDYYKILNTELAHKEKTFSKSNDIRLAFESIYGSDEYKKFLNSL